MPAKIPLLDWNAWPEWPARALVFSLLVFPMVPALFHVRMLLLVVVLVIVAVLALKTCRLGVHPAVALWTLALSALAFLFVLEGLIFGAPGAASQATVYVIYPLIYLAMISGVRNQRILSGVGWTLVVSTCCISVYSIVYLLIQTGVLPESRLFSLLTFDWEAQAFGLHEGYIAMQFPGLNSLPFLVPFSIASLVTLTSRAAGLSVWLRAFLWVSALLAFGSVLLSGRRALYLATLLAPFLTWAFLSFQPALERVWSKKALFRITALGALTLVISLVPLNAVYGVTFSGLVDRLSVGFNFGPTSEDDGALERHQQFSALLAGWTANPVLGAGHGAPAFGSVRSELEPWSYELSYMALLYQTGLVGMAAYGAGIFWIYWMGVRVIRSGGYLSALMVACLVGMTSILIANATNPYVARFDGMWSIFLPIALINLWLLRPSAPVQPVLALSLRSNVTR